MAKIYSTYKRAYRPETRGKKRQGKGGKTEDERGMEEKDIFKISLE